jgi:hypothetical protein
VAFVILEEPMKRDRRTQEIGVACEESHHSWQLSSWTRPFEKWSFCYKGEVGLSFGKH